MRAALIFGGTSTEHDISCRSAENVMAALVPGAGLQALPVAGGARPLEVDVALPVLHGQGGEDGTLQGALEVAGMPYVGCGVMASVVFNEVNTMPGLTACSRFPQMMRVAGHELGDVIAGLIEGVRA